MIDAIPFICKIVLVVLLVVTVVQVFDTRRLP